MVCNARIALPNDGPNLSAENLQADRGQSGRCLQSAQAAIAAMERRGQAALAWCLSPAWVGCAAQFLTGYCHQRRGQYADRSAGRCLGAAEYSRECRVSGADQTALVDSSPCGAGHGTYAPTHAVARMGQPSEVGDAVAWLSGRIIPPLLRASRCRWMAVNSDTLMGQP
jgi:hypothetical protein